MALTVGELQVILELQAEQFRSSLTRLERRLSSFETSNNTRLDRINNGFLTVRRAVLAVGAALAAIGITRGLVSLVRSSIQASASFEQLEVRLRAFLGSQEDASQALREFIELSAQTPFSVQEVAAAGAALGAVALGNRESLLELTQTASNLAAVTGLALPEAASNLQRALQAGIASADLFRERGVRALVEAVQDIPDLTALPLQQANEAILATFGPDGVFSTAAEDLQFTLGGALSNVGDAVERFQAALGDAIGPAVIAGLREFLIPLFERLALVIAENEGEIRNFAERGVVLLIRGFAALARGAAVVAQALATFQRGLRVARVNLNAVTLAIVRFLNLFNGIPDVVRNSLSVINPAFGALSTLARGVSDETVASLQSVQEQLESEAGMRTFLDDLADGAEVAAEQATEFARSFAEVDFDSFGQDAEAAAARLAELRARFEEIQRRQQGGVLDARTLRQNEQALARVERQVQAIGDADLARLEPLQLQVVQIDRQLAALAEVQQTEENALRIEAARNALLLERTRLTENLVDAVRRQAEAQADVQDLLGRLRLVDPDEAEELGRQFARAFESAEGAEARARVAEDFAQKIQDALDDVDPSGATATITMAFGDALRFAFEGSSQDFLQNFAQALQDRAAESLSRSFDQAIEGLQESLTNLFNELAPTFQRLFSSGASDGTRTGLLGSLGEFGGQLGGLLGAAIPTAISAALRDDEVTSAAGNIQSAVTSAQQVRGIVAGPQQVAIAEVGRSIQEAFRESERLLGIIASNTGTIAVNSSPSTGSSAPGAGTEAEAVLTNESASLV